MNESAACPCGAGQSYATCCGPFLAGEAHAPTAEALMRSRFTAHVRVATAYLVGTVAADRRDQHPAKDVEAWASSMEWLRLEILATEAGGPSEQEGKVEFRAWYRDRNGLQCMHERSRFHREDGQWRYIDGTQPAARNWRKATSRNDACPCGSGRKFKKCCA